MPVRYCALYPNVHVPGYVPDAQALKTLHTAGFAHGDIRCENILLEEGTDKVGGFYRGKPSNPEPWGVKLEGGSTCPVEEGAR